MAAKTEVPTGTVFTITVPLDRSKKNIATFHIKEMTEEVFMAAKSMTDVGKDFDAVRLVIKELYLGGDATELLKNNYVAISSASRQVMEFMKPIDVEIKKN